MLATFPSHFKSTSPADFISKYQTVGHIGSGSTSNVVCAIRFSDNLRVAIKTIRKSDNVVFQFKFDREFGCSVPLEVFLLKRLRHAGIISFVDYGEDDYNFYIVTEFHGFDICELDYNTCDSGYEECDFGRDKIPTESCLESCDLFSYVERYQPSEASIFVIFSQILAAVAYLHEHNIVHRDIKDENICIDSNFVTKIIDFGSAEKYSIGSNFNSFRGSLLYTPPELLESAHHRGPEADVWCLGIVLYILAFSGSPFTSVKDISNQRYACTTIKRSDDLQDLISLMLDPNPNTRITCTELCKHQLLSNLINRL